MNDESWRNIETTSTPTVQSDDFYINKLEISDVAIKNKVYLEPLSNKETVALLAKNIVIYYVQNKRYEDALLTCDLILDYSPKDIGTYVNKAAIYDKWIKHNLSKTPEAKMTKKESEQLKFMRNMRTYYLTRAEDLGWRDQSEFSKSNYSQFIQSLRRT